MIKRGAIPNMGDVSAATRVQLSALGGRPSGRSGRRSTRKSRRSGKARPARSKRATRATARRAKRGGKLRKGSAAAKAWGKRMRALRKRR
jgi:hypothetical protein